MLSRTAWLLASTALSIALGLPASADESQAVAPSGHIEGRVDVRLNFGRRRRPALQSLGAKPSSGISDRKRTVVYLERAPRGAFEAAESERPVLDQTDETFSPYVLPVQVGTLVQFPNNDNVFHNVFSLSKTRKFDLGRYPKGQSKSVRFSEPGVVRVFCDIHSHMSAFVVVFSHRFFAITNNGGDYRIADVPPGRYTLVAWTDGEIRASASVDVLAGEVTRADFTVQ